MTDTVLAHHLLAAHPGARAPWFAHSGYIGTMSPDALERLHAELVAQGEDCQVVLDETRPNWGARLRNADAAGAA